MAKDKQILLQEFRSRPVAYILQIFGVVVILLNMWLATKLYPLAKSVDEVIASVEVVKEDVRKLQAVEIGYNNLFIEIKELRVKIDSISDRIERIDNRLSKHLGI